MSIQQCPSIASVYSAYGSQGLTISGKRERHFMIAIMSFGAFLLAIGITSLVLSILLNISSLPLGSAAAWSTFQTLFFIVGTILVMYGVFRLRQGLPEYLREEFINKPSLLENSDQGNEIHEQES
jgi:hypothetical protein